MIINLLALVALIVLFVLLGKAADLVVVNLRDIGQRLGIKIFLLGILLGLMTSLPEMAIAVNSSVNNVLDISFGHLMGGVVVLLALVLPISIILNRRIKTNKKSLPFLSILFVLFLPLLLGFKGELNFFDGLILMGSYLLLLYYLYRQNDESSMNISINTHVFTKKHNGKSIFVILLGIVGIIVFSDLIVKTTMFLLEDYNISPFIIGLLFYSVGTNLPELTIAFRSFKRKTEDLSFSNLIGAAIANILILGVLSSWQTVSFNIDISYIFLMLFSLILFIFLYVFYKTDTLLSRLEAYFLLFLYFIFVSSQLFIQFRY